MLLSGHNIFKTKENTQKEQNSKRKLKQLAMKWHAF